MLVVMTDDQAVDDMRAMELTRRRIGGQGTTFKNHFAALPGLLPVACDPA